MAGHSHQFAARLIWDGNKGDGTANYATYGRQYRIVVAGKADIAGSADPAFRGDADRHNPEDLFVASISACHLLTYLALCAKNKIRVVEYEDDASGTMTTTPHGGGKFDEVTLRPRVTIDAGDVDLAKQLHEKAHELCFIASSVSCPIHHEPTIVTR